MMMTFGLECAVLRTEKLTRGGRGRTAALYTALFSEKTLATVETSASAVIALCSEGDERRTQLALVRKLLRHETADSISIGRQVAADLLSAGRYTV
jgi:butyryl-CoA dehydrogenase